VDKCIALLKRYLPRSANITALLNGSPHDAEARQQQHCYCRYKASQQVLERAEDFCAHATTSLSAMSPGEYCALCICISLLPIVLLPIVQSQQSLQTCSHAEELDVSANHGDQADGQQETAQVNHSAN